MKESISRREMLAASVSTSVFAGCISETETEDKPFSQLRVAADAYEKNDKMYVDVKVHHDHPTGTTFHNITVIGYSRTGETVFREEFGDSTYPGELQKWFTVEPAEFPFIIAVTADESPCTEGLTFEVIRWNGTDAQQLETYPEDNPDYAWEEFERQCNEDLPPQRLLPTSGGTTPSSTSGD